VEKLLEIIRERRSARWPYDVGRPVSGEDLRKILEAGRWAPTAHNMQNFEIVVVDDKKILEDIGRIERPISEVFVRENYQQLSFSEEELKKKGVGLLGAMFPPSWLDPDFKIEKVGGKGGSPLARPLPASRVLLVVVTDPSKRAPASEGDYLGILSLGCVMENMWLMASALGIDFQIVSSLTADSVEEEVKKILDIPENLRIAFVCRMGYPVSAPRKWLRVRREVEDFSYHNKFGKRGIMI
jgi:nitroreductase